MASLMHEFGPPKFHLLGTNALVADLGAPYTLEKQERIWHVHARAANWRGIAERVPGMNNITLLFDPAVVDAQLLQVRILEALSEPSVASNDATKTVEISVSYGGDAGPDLSQVAATAGLTDREVIDRHRAQVYRVYFVGFQPGFAYLGDLDESLALPRRAQPRTRVPAGSVAIAGGQTAVYPFDSPGGWHIIGRTEIALFDPRRDPAALLAPGDRVRFVEAT